jgi:hypothetical protein
VTTVHLEPVLLVLRVYEEGSFEEGSEYTTVATVHKMDRQAWITATHGTLSTAIVRKIIAAIKELDVDTIHWRHKGKYTEIAA